MDNKSRELTVVMILSWFYFEVINLKSGLSFGSFVMFVDVNVNSKKNDP